MAAVGRLGKVKPKRWRVISNCSRKNSQRSAEILVLILPPTSVPSVSLRSFFFIARYNLIREP